MGANAIQSAEPPKPPVRVTVTDATVVTVVALTARTGAVWTENGRVSDVSPVPESKTVICAVPITVISLAGIDARTRPLLTNVVTRSAPFQLTTELTENPLPSIVSVKAAPPTGAPTGDSELMIGGPGRTVTVGLVANLVYP